MSYGQEKLPVIVGFILPNREILQAGGIGHCRVAREYIKKVGQYQNYVNSKLSSEDEYLIEYMGAIKVAVYRGTRYIFIPRIRGWYLDEMAKLYIERGFCPLYLDTNYTCEKIEECSNHYNYNLTVVEQVEPNGKVSYCYNPMRIGD